MTVVAESDFQSRPAIFRTNQASVFSSTIGSGTSPQSRTSQGKYLRPESACSRKHSEFSGRESRWLRVERKALVSCPTLNERL